MITAIPTAHVQSEYMSLSLPNMSISLPDDNSNSYFPRAKWIHVTFAPQYVGLTSQMITAIPTSHVQSEYMWSSLPSRMHVLLGIGRGRVS